jgi:hypothetical protein
MAPITVKNDAGHAIATVRTHGRSGWIEVNARRRWNTADARNVAAALVAAADAQDNPAPPPVTEDPVDLAEPPRHGRGASREAWAAYAAHRGVPVTPDMGREDIVSACEMVSA